MPATADRTHTATPNVQDAAWTVDALRSVWRHQQHRVNERIGLIERAVAELADGRLGSDLRSEAERAAHMLAGSLGMFGFIPAADAARRLERELAHPTIDRAPALSVLLAKVRDGVQGPVVLCGRHPDDEAHEGSR
jgi:HPt (histidine-containing phosphotransfer) domain-containing protein